MITFAGAPAIVELAGTSLSLFTTEFAPITAPLPTVMPPQRTAPGATKIPSPHWGALPSRSPVFDVGRKVHHEPNLALSFTTIVP